MLKKTEMKSANRNPMLNKLIVTSLVIFGACGTDDGGDAEDLTGVWQSECIAGTAEDNDSQLFEFTFEETKMVFISRQYGDSTCGEHISSSEFVATYKTADGESLNEIDLVVAEFWATAETDAAAALFNQFQVGGYTDWVAGTKKDFIGVDLEGESIDVGDEVLGIYEIADGEMTLDMNDPTAKAERPKAFTTEAFSLTKQ